MKNNIDQLLNVIELMKKGLEFYSNSRNYDGPMGTIAPIADDEYGSQARFVLEQLKTIENINHEMEKDYETLINDFNIKKSQEEMINNIEIFKQLGGDNNV